MPVTRLAASKAPGGPLAPRVHDIVGAAVGVERIGKACPFGLDQVFTPTGRVICVREPQSRRVDTSQAPGGVELGRGPPGCVVEQRAAAGVVVGEGDVLLGLLPEAIRLTPIQMPFPSIPFWDRTLSEPD